MIKKSKNWAVTAAYNFSAAPLCCSVRLNLPIAPMTVFDCFVAKQSVGVECRYWPLYSTLKKVILFLLFVIIIFVYVNQTISILFCIPFGELMVFNKVNSCFLL